jgi:hypothetical protein
MPQSAPAPDDADPTPTERELELAALEPWRSREDADWIDRDDAETAVVPRVLTPEEEDRNERLRLRGQLGRLAEAGDFAAIADLTGHPIDLVAADRAIVAAVRENRLDLVAKHCGLASTMDLRRAAPKAANDNRPAYPGIVSSREFIAGFVPPDYHVDHVAQAGFLYSVTAMTGTGKTAVMLLLAALTGVGGSLGEHEVRKGRVLYLAGENPDDARMRWIAMSHHVGFDVDTIDVHFVPGSFDIAGLMERIRADVETLGAVDMIVVDTSAAYFLGDDENSNTALGQHARTMRGLTTLPGRPVVFVACHPTKNAEPTNLQPRGGGAFIAEVDGNLTLTRSGALVKLHWQGKHRGPDFEPLWFAMEPVSAPALVDSKGRNVPTVMAVSLAGPTGNLHGVIQDVPPAKPTARGIALDHLREAIRTVGITPPSPDISGGAMVVAADTWRDKCYAADGSATQAAKQKSFVRAKTALVSSGDVVEFGQWVWIP